MSYVLALSIFPICLVLAAAYDVTTLTIPNWISAILAACFLLLALASGMSGWELATHVSIAAATLVAGFCLFAAGYIGGGDAKLLAAISLWIGWEAYVPYLLSAVIAGGVVALAVLFARQFPLPLFLASRPWIARLHEPGSGIPYGVALAAGGLVVFSETPIFHMLSS